MKGARAKRGKIMLEPSEADFDNIRKESAKNTDPKPADIDERFGRSPVGPGDAFGELQRRNQDENDLRN